MPHSSRSEHGGAIDADIRRAHSLPAAFYCSEEQHAAVRDHVLARTWHFVGERGDLTQAGDVLPFELLPGSVAEPLLLTHDAAGTLRCLSNVCTHRGNLVQRSRANCRGLRCGYHGRRFGLDGSFESMPEFEGALDFPSPADALPAVPLHSFGDLLFASLEPLMDFDEVFDAVRERVGDLPLSEFRVDPSRSQDYLVDANWALYVDNFLEGFHIPYVHPALAQAVEFDTYTTELFKWGNVQVARARGDDPRFEGTDIAAYYFWLFPGTMLNFYPWGLSLNAIQPLGVQQTRVLFRSFVWKPELLDSGAGANLDQVEQEDEDIVECVQRGVRSRLYRRGRYSPQRELGVHQFHRLLVGALPS